MSTLAIAWFWDVEEVGKEGLNGSPRQKLEFLFFSLLLSQLPACPWLLLPRIFLVTVTYIVGSFDELAFLAEESGWFLAQ